MCRKHICTRRRQWLGTPGIHRQINRHRYAPDDDGCGIKIKQPGQHAEDAEREFRADIFRLPAAAQIQDEHKGQQEGTGKPQRLGDDGGIEQRQGDAEAHCRFRIDFFRNGDDRPERQYPKHSRRDFTNGKVRADAQKRADKDPESQLHLPARADFAEKRRFPTMPKYIITNFRVKMVKFFSHLL